MHYNGYFKDSVPNKEKMEDKITLLSVCLSRALISGMLGDIKLKFKLYTEIYSPTTF